ncbi:MAG TPA: PEP-CTERM sorting domain-containing protein [Tepidisphaeraceae bacterium]|jgi:hypothetical protein|nr:PEP-CTERM sorting domain-containing protein [Tepidisphaeraceae bacterium]
MAVSKLKVNRWGSTACGLVVLALAPAAARAALVASDMASNPTYSVGQAYNGLNGGTGFQPWSTIPTVNYGSNNGAPVNGPSDAGNSLGATAFSLYAFNNNGDNGSAFATRAFTDNSGTGAGALDAGQTFSFDFDNRLIATGSTVGFELTDATGAAGFRFDFLGGGDDYRTTDAAGTTELTGFGYTGSGLRLSVTLTGADTYSFTATKLNGGQSVTTVGTLAENAGLDRVLVFNRQGGDQSDLNFTNLAVTTAVPEPGTMAIAAVAAGGLLARRRPR